jgi:hypothetical protein
VPKPEVGGVEGGVGVEDGCIAGAGLPKLGVPTFGVTNGSIGMTSTASFLNFIKLFPDLIILSYSFFLATILFIITIE